jgi:hypothetical protein
VFRAGSLVVAVALALTDTAAVAQTPPAEARPQAPPPTQSPDAEQPRVPVTALPEVVVIGISPLRGVGIGRDKLPAKAQSLPPPDVAKQGLHPASNVAMIRSRVIGRSRIRVPKACETALAIAAAVGPAVASPTPSGTSVADSTISTSISGTSLKRSTG